MFVARVLSDVDRDLTSPEAAAADDGDDEVDDDILSGYHGSDERRAGIKEDKKDIKRGNSLRSAAYDAEEQLGSFCTLLLLCCLLER